jgi:uncharacterized protein YndB with AHSA1/START domain
MSIVEGTVELTREFAQPIDIVFKAWSSEEAQRAWSDPGDGWQMTLEQFRFQVGETDICRFGPRGGPQYMNENRYLAIEPEERIVYSTSLRTPERLNFAGTVAVTFEPIKRGTRMRLIEQGLYFNDDDDVAGHRAGWQNMLDALEVFLAPSFKAVGND